MTGPPTGRKRINGESVLGRGCVDKLTAADVNPDVVDRFIVYADRIEEDEISLAKIALADVRAGRLLIPRAPLQVDADLGEDEFRKRRAIEDQPGRVARAEVVFDAAHVAFGDGHDAIGLRADRGRTSSVIRVPAACRYVTGVAPLILDFQPVAVHLRDDVDILARRNQADDPPACAGAGAQVHAVRHFRLIGGSGGSRRRQRGLSGFDRSEPDGRAQAERHQLTRDRFSCRHVNPSKMYDLSGIHRNINSIT